MNIDIRKIRHVLEVAHYESITTAAEFLCISQSALTRSIADVEQQLGVQLFLRVRRGVRLTEAGQVFVGEARWVVKSVENLFATTENYLNLNPGKLKIGVAPASYQAILNSTLVRMIKDYPGLKFEITCGSAEHLAPRVIRGDLDLLWGAARPLVQWPELKLTVVRDFYYGAIIRKKHPLTHLKKIQEFDLLKYPVSASATADPLHIDIARRYAPNGLPPMQPHYVTDDFELVKSVVATTDAFSPVASLAPFGKLAEDFIVLEGVLDIPTQQLAYAVSGEKSNSPAVEAFAKAVVNTFE